MVVSHLFRVHPIIINKIITTTTTIIINNIIIIMLYQHDIHIPHPCPQVTAVDKTAPTIMCVVGLVESISKQWGPDISAIMCLPVLTPLMIAPSLSHQQFSILTR